jgi:hypothetical protein
MLTSSSPLLNGQDVTDPLAQTQFSIQERKKPRARSRADWTWISVASSIFNTTILLGLLYGVGICISTIRNTLMPTNEYCLHSISVSYNYITFSGEGYNTYYGPRCLNPLRTISTYASGKTLCTDKEIKVGFEKIRREFLDWRHVVANITDDDIAKMRVVEFDEIPTGTNITEPVRLSKSFFRRVGNTLVCPLQLLSRFRQLTSIDDLGVRDELASSIGLCSLWFLGCYIRCLGTCPSSQSQLCVSTLVSHASKQDSTNNALIMDVDQGKSDHPASIWLASPTSSILVYHPDTYGEHRCNSFLSSYDISFCIPLSSDI